MNMLDREYLLYHLEDNVEDKDFVRELDLPSRQFYLHLMNHYTNSNEKLAQAVLENALSLDGAFLLDYMNTDEEGFKKQLKEKGMNDEEIEDDWVNQVYEYGEKQLEEDGYISFKTTTDTVNGDYTFIFKSPKE